MLQSKVTNLFASLQMSDARALLILRPFYLTEQVGQEILSNLNSDREKIQRARERVSERMPPAHTRLSILTSVCESAKVLQLLGNVDGILHSLRGLPSTRCTVLGGGRGGALSHRVTVVNVRIY